MRRALIGGILAATAMCALGVTNASASTFTFAPPGMAAAPVIPNGVPVHQDLGKIMTAGSQRASRVLGHTVTFDAPMVDSVSAPHFADTIDRTIRAFEDSPLVLNGREKTITVRKVLFVAGDRPDVRLQGDVLKIAISVQMGKAGRPTSELIFHVLTTQAPA